MSVVSQFLDYFDAPRFCPDCGENIWVRDEQEFDPKTGAVKEHWVWSCPEVSLEVTHRGIVQARQSGDSIHPYGDGRPRWHRNG